MLKWHEQCENMKAGMSCLLWEKEDKVRVSKRVVNSGILLKELA